MQSPVEKTAEQSQATLSAKEQSKQVDAHAIEEGLLALLHPSISSMDAKVYSCKRSQSELSACIDSVAADLKRMSDSMPNPQQLDVPIRKLAHARRKINVVNSILHNCQERLRRVHQSVVRDTANKQNAIATLYNQQPQSSTSINPSSNPPITSPSTVPGNQIVNTDTSTTPAIDFATQPSAGRQVESADTARVESAAEPKTELVEAPLESTSDVTPIKSAELDTSIEATARPSDLTAEQAAEQIPTTEEADKLTDDSDCS